ncbi:MAG: hypothetical protein ACK4E7_08050 [Permianibacter sp.]
MPRLALSIALALLLLIAVLAALGWLPLSTAMSPDTELANSVTAEAQTAVANTEIAVTEAGVERAALTTASTAASYCAPAQEATQRQAALQQFRQAHPNLMVSDVDMALLLDVMPELNRLASMSFVDHDVRAFTVYRSERYQGRDVRSLEADAVAGEPEAALIYGSYLLYNAYHGDKAQAGQLDHAGMARGREFLLVAHQAGQQDALSRIYINTKIAAHMLWRRSGRSAEWQALDAEQTAWEAWFLQHGPSHAAAALIQYGRDGGYGPQNPRGEPYPVNSHDDANRLRRVQELMKELAAAPLSATEQQRREQLMWLQQRGLIENAMLIWFQNCEPAQNN